MTVPPAAGPPGLPGRLTALVRTLREHGLRIGPGETVDAAAVLEVLGLDDRERVREGLAAALVHRDGERPTFDVAFELYFPRRVGDSAVLPPSDTADADADDAAVSPHAPPGTLPLRGADLAELREQLAEALAAADRAALTRLAAESVTLFGRYGAGDGSGGWSSYQTLERLQPQTLLAPARAASAVRGDFTDRLTDDELRRRIEEFRALVREEARRRLAELRGAEQLARHAVAPTPDRIDFLLAGRDQLLELRRTVQPLARRLAARLAARRRRAARGRIDLRRTLRRSLSTGGVPLRPAYRLRRPARPELVLLCDVSGSVAGFSDFTMLLVRALHDQFSKVRVFAFVNRVDEVTRLVAGRSTADPGSLSRRILAEAAVAGWHGNSDYGSALGEFVERHRDAVGPRTSVLVLGDARTNHRDPNLPALRQLTERARRVYWLNPEPAAQWGTGDSAALQYAVLADMHECRNARQLGEIVSRMLPV